MGICDRSSNTFYLWNSESQDLPPLTFQFGVTGRGLIPLAGDWNGDRIDSIGMYDPATSVFHLRNSNSSDADDLVIKYGEPGKSWIPLAGDWDGDAIDTVGLYDPKQSFFYLKNPLKTDPDHEIKLQYGVPNQGWAPITGDWDGDRVDSIGLYDPKESVFHLKNMNEAGMPDITVPYGLPNRDLKPVSGYSGKRISRDHFDVVGLFDPSQVRFYLNVAAFFGKMKLDHVYSGADGDIYKVKDPVPRAYIVPAAEVVDSPREALLRFTDLSFDPLQAVIVESEELKKAGVSLPSESAAIVTAKAGAPVSNSGARGGAEVLKRSFNTMTVKVDSLQEGWLVVAESWDKGWSATVDGRAAPVLPGNYVFRTMRIPAGRHTVELVYRPAGFLLGSTISGATAGLLIIAAAIWLFKRRRRNSVQRQCSAAAG